jgi:hypothetical protein
MLLLILHVHMFLIESFSLQAFMALKDKRRQRKNKQYKAIKLAILKL